MKTVIFGTSNLARLLFAYLTEDNASAVDAFVVDTITPNLSLPRPILTYDSILPHASEYRIYNSVGYYDMNIRRERVTQRLLNDGFVVMEFVHPTAQIAKNATRGIANIFLEYAVVQPYCTIGNGNVFFAHTCLAHHSAVGNFNWFAPGTTIGGEVTIRSNCFFGLHSTVKSELTIENFTLCGAHAFCAKNTEPHQVIKAVHSPYTVEMYEIF